ncbi:hypothetical protein M426DRAFT_232013 [Hypoxylon sp. CI-4A]|nr:hypothetical protein M426DRAFT_232013 [Hypoxylon sp. CI-4A]
MPKLHTFISQPMHSSRTLITLPTGDLINAQLLRDKPGHLPNRLLYSSLDLFSYDERSPFTRFCFSDTTQFSLVPNFKEFPLLPTRLTHLDMCISIVGEPKGLGKLRDFIMAAKGLTYLRLCLKRAPRRYMVKEEFDGVERLVGKSSFHFLLGDPALHLPNLKSAHLTCMSPTQEELAEFVKTHAETLMVLRIGYPDFPDILFDFTGMAKPTPLVLFDTPEVLDTLCELGEIDDITITSNDPDKWPPLPGGDWASRGDMSDVPPLPEISNIIMLALHLSENPKTNCCAY